MIYHLTNRHFREASWRAKLLGMKQVALSLLVGTLAVSLFGCRTPAPLENARSRPMTEASFVSSVRKRPVLDSFLAYRETGAGAPVVFLHGNPTSSYVWRNVVPHVAGSSRCIAPDLVGMGASGKPDIAYRYADHVRYLDAWFSSMDLRDVTLVGYDWGGVLALDWASRHADCVRGVVVFETFLRGMHLRDLPPAGQQLFGALRTPGVGEKLVLEENVFLAKSLEAGVTKGLSSADRDVYFAPFPDPSSRRPVLAFPRELPFDGSPPEVLEVLERNAAWLARRDGIGKALFTFDSGLMSNAPAVVRGPKRRSPSSRSRRSDTPDTTRRKMPPTP